VDITNVKPKIDYPCEWSYQLIGRDADTIAKAAKTALGDKRFQLEKTRQSAKGSFISMRLELIVDCEEERLGFFNALKQEKSIIYIL
jgi:putative lipoic acid-binding regulatory protein